MLECVRTGTPLEIWGDGENIRDFIYIDDIVEVCMRLIDLPQDSGTYNLGSGVGYSISQLRYIVEKSPVPNSKFLTAPLGISMCVPWFWISTSFAKNCTGLQRWTWTKGCAGLGNTFESLHEKHAAIHRERRAGNPARPTRTFCDEHLCRGGGIFP